MHKIKLVHILTETDTPREIASVDSVSQVSNYGVEYIQQINVRYKGDDCPERYQTRSRLL